MTDFTLDWQTWHRAHEERRASPHGFLAVTSIRWLDAEPTRFADAPGTWHDGRHGVVVELAEVESLLVEGREVTGRHLFGVLPERDSVTAGFGDAVVEIARRGDAHVLRPRHPDTALRRAYAGTPAYDPDPAWAVTGRLERYDQPVPTPVGSVVEGLEHVYDSVGEIAVDVAGTPLRLLAFGEDDGPLVVLFRDATSGVTTYPAVRSLRVERPAAGDEVVVDFNRATNLPCAYTPYATCPLPPAQNVLTVAIEAGERLPVGLVQTE
ncbi:DUF1684 domain-containing protein [Nocardioides mangrovicus]|uniref:DUF1684 domain-containing protein n=1 Tax=Nocardioides mangrovicus TaxID=2478913 RepID=A0A3L8P0T5_9ACTN|nr:DUF1684 domain-containing protein [Nocardioides mangrovicus]RLV48209.1 DUF1684 domain-containing protein [Nocardioides mangrovicus]